MDHTPSYWHARRVFVTGCTGFLGTHVVRELVARGAAVVGLVRDRVPDSEFVADRLFDSVSVVRGRIEDGFALRQAMAVHEIETVFHLAAPPVGTDPDEATAAGWVRAVLDAARDVLPHGRAVVPVHAAGRDACQKAALEFATASRYPVTVGRLPTLFGPGDRRADALLPRSILAVLTGEPVTPPRREELGEPHLDAARAATELVQLAEDSAADPVLIGRAVPLGEDPPSTGADVILSLRRPDSSGLSLAVARAVTWHRDRLAEARPAVRAA